MLGTYRGEFEPILDPGQKEDPNDAMQGNIEVVKVRGADTNGDIVLVLGSVEDVMWDLSAESGKYPLN